MTFRGCCGQGWTLSVIDVPSSKTKFMQMLDSQTYRVLEKEARSRGASIQELLRTVIIPDWLTENRKHEKPR
jgi:hypothetical protein